MFCSRNGTPLEYNTIRRSHLTTCQKANIRVVTLHSLRHTFATRSIETGIDVKTVSELLGHASIEITLNTYVHSTDKTKKSTADTIEKFYQSLLS